VSRPPRVMRLDGLSFGKPTPILAGSKGRVPTAGAQAKAFAPHSAPGRNPNMVISPLSAYPAWTPVATKNVIPEFSVDLNDNLPLGELTTHGEGAREQIKEVHCADGDEREGADDGRGLSYESNLCGEALGAERHHHE
jgi:hypothetical protein